MSERMFFVICSLMNVRIQGSQKNFALESDDQCYRLLLSVYLMLWLIGVNYPITKPIISCSNEYYAFLTFKLLTAEPGNMYITQDHCYNKEQDMKILQAYFHRAAVGAHMFMGKAEVSSKPLYNGVHIWGLLMFLKLHFMGTWGHNDSKTSKTHGSPQLFSPLQLYFHPTV